MEFVYKSFIFRVSIGAWEGKKEDDWVGEEVDRDGLMSRWHCSVSVHLQRRHLSHFENDDSALVCCHRFPFSCGLAHEKNS